MSRTVDHRTLEHFAAETLQRAGMRAGAARIVAESLVAADLRGVDSHGVARLGTYLARVEKGVMRIDPDMHLVRDSPSTAVLDAANGFGQVAGTQAMLIAVDKAKATGAGSVSVANSNHFGIAGYFAELAADAGCIGIVLTNASPAMAPYNATTPLLGTNPMAFAIPRRGGPHIVLDMSSSLVARGKIRRAAHEGRAIPEGWANDAAGRPTMDAQAALKGLLAPIGGAKGAGLALVVDILTGLLSGTGLTGEVTNVTDTSRPSRTGHLVVALDIAHFSDTEDFASRVGHVASDIGALPAADCTRVYLPGEIEYEKRCTASEHGLELPDDVIAELEELATRYGAEPLLVS